MPKKPAASPSTSSGSTTPAAKGSRRSLQRILDAAPRDVGAEALREKIRLLAPDAALVVCKVSDVTRVLDQLEGAALAAKVTGSTIEPGREVADARESMPLRIRQTVATALRAFAGLRGVSLNRAANELFAAALGITT